MTSAHRESFILAGDIGGTKTNLGLFTRGKRRPVLKVMETYPSQKAPNLEYLIGRFLENYPVSISNACFGVAGPVKGGQCDATNLPWRISEKGLTKLFGWDHASLINDLTATAHAVPLLTRREVFSLNQGRVDKRGCIGLIAPGTGLGMALLIWKDGQYLPVSSEGGHMDFAPNNASESDLWQYVHQRLGHVSLERILSGPGLFIIYAWLKYTAQGTEPAWLTERPP